MWVALPAFGGVSARPRSLLPGGCQGSWLRGPCRYMQEFGFTIPERPVIVDDIRVRGTGSTGIGQEPPIPASGRPARVETVRAALLPWALLRGQVPVGLWGCAERGDVPPTWGWCMGHGAEQYLPSAPPPPAHGHWCVVGQEALDCASMGAFLR